MSTMQPIAILFIAFTFLGAVLGGSIDRIGIINNWKGHAGFGVSTSSADSLAQALEKQRAETDQWLRGSPSSYFAAVGRTDFGDRSVLTVGRSAENDVVLNEPFVAERHLSVAVQGDSFTVRTLDPKAFFTVSGNEVQSAVVGPSAIWLGRFRLRLSHQHYPAIIVFDPESPHFKEYQGLRHYPIDASFRLNVPLTVNPHPDTVIILSTRGNKRRALRVGWFEFTLEGTECKLEAHRLLEPGIGEESVSLFFTDKTSGTETYPVGRYVDPEPIGGGRYILDFNRAYNPVCAYSDYYNCPIPPEANHLLVPVRAGEMDPHGSQH
jgi:uncharacterized protein (DUF1684 family)